MSGAFSVHRTTDSKTEMIERSPAVAAVKALIQSVEVHHAGDVQEENNDLPEVEVARLRELVCQLLLKNERLRQCLADILPTTDRVDPVVRVDQVP
jgi:hypothetical protein